MKISRKARVNDEPLGSNTPLSALNTFFECRIYPKVIGKKQRELLRQFTRIRPLVLNIETTNVCNAVCGFCAYPRSNREKGVMSLSLFEKIVKEYADMGGGALNLTPIVGEPLLDPYLLDRFKILKSYPKINRVSLATNAIALEKYTDEQVGELLQTVSYLVVSIGGLDAGSYKSVFGVDKFHKVEVAMERLIRLRDTVPNSAPLCFGFRTNDPEFAARYKNKLMEYRDRGVAVHHISAYHDFGGFIDTGEENPLAFFESHSNMHRTCIYPAIMVSICWDGTVTACGDSDFDAKLHVLGHAAEENIAAICSGEKRRKMLDSFEKGELTDTCKKCSAYVPDIVFARPIFSKVKPDEPLPLEFFSKVMI